MSQLDPEDIQQQSRQQTMELNIDLETQIYEWANSFLINLSPQRVYTVPSSFLFISFERALFNRQRDGPITWSIKVYLNQCLIIFCWDKYMIKGPKD